MFQQMMGPDGKIEVTNTPKEAQLFSAMIWHESGGNQFSKDGTPLVSPKGAAGVAQVMESTGPEAARLAGVPWDRDKWLNDPKYNAQIGQAYFSAQMQKYDNNPVLAVAAYNAGPGAVDDWIKQIGDPRTGRYQCAVCRRNPIRRNTKLCGKSHRQRWRHSRQCHDGKPHQSAILECDEPTEQISHDEQDGWHVRHAGRRRARIVTKPDAG
jgi:hypothetical protein